VSSEGLLWYIFPVERLVGFFLVKLFFPAKKAQDDRWEVVYRVIQNPNTPPPSKHLGLFWREKNFKFFLAAAADET
jgi:hypothetical protein